MERTYVIDLSAGMKIDQVFLVSDKDMSTATSGQQYIRCYLRDKTGQINARQWQATPRMYEMLPSPGFARISGRVEDYRGNLQFIIEAAKPMDTQSVDAVEFLPVSAFDLDEMWERTLVVLRTVKQPDLLQMIDKFVKDDELMTQFRRVPAAVTMHHAFIGGLLEHTLSMLELAQKIRPHYPQLDWDLIVTALFLHDIGKCEELSCEVGFNYTDVGQLVGHIVIATNWIQQKADEIASETDKAFPPQVLAKLKHLVLAHHGSYEFGTPKLPAMAEAFLIHHLDNMDAKIYMVLKNIESDSNADSRWTAYNRALNTRLYKD